MDLKAEIEVRLNKAFQPSLLEVVDESYQHVGHAGSAGGAKHFKVIINAEIFSTSTKLEVHRMIYNVLSDLMPFPIHALRIVSNSQRR